MNIEEKKARINQLNEELEVREEEHRRLMQELVSHPNFKRFGLLWQDFQNFIHKKL